MAMVRWSCGAASSCKSPPKLGLSRRLRAIACALLMLVAVDGREVGAAAGGDIRALQWDLVWAGHYEGTVDGRQGPSTARAVQSYQASIGAPVTGELAAAQREQLAAAADALEADIGWTVYENPTAGYRIGYPAAILPVARALGANSQEFSSEDGSATLATIVTGADSEATFRQSFDRTVADKANQVVYKIFKPTWFVVSYVIDRSGYYVLSRRKPSATASYVLRWPKAEDPFFRPLATAIFNSFVVPDDLTE